VDLSDIKNQKLQETDIIALMILQGIIAKKTVNGKT